jgi:tetratricopeptide (TPR) repeat protein
VREGVVLIAVLWAQAAWAAPVSVAGLVNAQVGPKSEALAQAQKALDDGEFETAVTDLERAIEREDLTDDQLAEAYRMLGLANLYLGAEDKARDAFEKLLQARPDYELPKGTPPKIRSLYSRIKDDIKKRRVRPVTLKVSAPSAAEPEQELDVPARIDDLPLGARARLFYRRAGVQSFSSTDFSREKGSRAQFHATIPSFALPAEDSSWELEYYVEVADAAQRRLAGSGDAFSPKPITVAAKTHGGEGRAPPKVEAAWYQNPWLWVGVGVGAAAVATGAALVLTGQQQGTLPVKIQIEGTP